MLMALPAILWFIVFAYLPMGGLVLAFKTFNYNDGIFGSPWSGLENFRFLYQSGTLLRLTVNTILFNMAFLITSIVLQITAAVFLSEMAGKWFKKIAQSVMFLPYFVSYVLLAALIYNLFNYENGVLNSLLASLNLPRIDIYGTPSLWKYILVFFYNWKWVGYGMVVYLAAIMAISQEYYEAARIDGAGMLQKIRYITLPMMMPTIMVIFLLNVGQIMRGQFELFYQIVGDNGMLFEATDIIDTYVFRSLVKSFDIGMGSAAGLYQSAFGLVLVLAVNALVKWRNKDYSLF